MPMPYDGATIAAALAAPSRTWDFRYDRLTKDGTLVGPLSLSDVKVAHNALADQIKRTCTANIQPDTGFDFLSDRARLYARLLMPDNAWQEWPLGTFLLTTADTPRGFGAPRGARPVTGYDLLQVLVEDAVQDRYVVAAGTNYVTAINTVLTGAGFSTSLVQPSSLTLPGAMEWEPGTAKVKIVNDLLAALNYTPLSMTALGVPESAPYVDPGSAQVLWAYTLDTASLVTPGTIGTLDLFSVPNIVVGVVSQPDRPALVATATNSSATSPLSTVRRGRNIVQRLENVEAADQATLQAIVDRTLAGASQQYETLVFSTGIMPVHDDSDVVTFDDGSGSGAVRYRETQWEMDLKAGATMKHTVRRVVAV